MALRATLGADFGEFTQALQGVELKLKTTSDLAKNVGRDLSSMVNSFSGTNLFRQAELTAEAVTRIGGASKLTEAEQKKVNRTVEEALAKYRALGQEAPPHLQKLAAETKQVGTATESWTASVGKMAAGYVTGLASLATVQQVLGGVVGFLTSSVQEAAAAEAAQKRLETAMRANGVATEGNRQAFANLAAEMQRTTVYEGDQIVALEALALQLGVLPSQMQPAITAAADLASGLGIGVEQALTMIVKANNESYTAFQRLGISIDTARAKAEGLPYVLEQINARMGGQAAAEVDTYAGRIAQLGNEWGDFKEAIGGVITANGLLADSFGSLTEILRGTTTVITDLKGHLAGLAAASLTGASGIIGYLATLGQAQAPKVDTSQITEGTMQARQAVSEVRTEIERLQKALDDYGKASEPVWTKQATAAQALKAEALTQWAQALLAASGAAQQAAPKFQALQGVLVSLGDARASALGFSGWAEPIAGTIAGIDKLLTKSREAQAATAAVGKAMGGLATGLPTATSQMGDYFTKAKTGSDETGKSFAAGLGKATDVVDTLSRVAEMSGHKTTAALLSTASATAKAFASGGPFAAAITLATSLLTSFGRSAEAKKDYAATDQIKKLQAELLKTYGSLEGIARAGGAAGAELVAAWGDRSQAGLKHFQDLLDDFNTKVGDSRQELKGLQATLAGRGEMDWSKAEELITKYGGTLDSLGTSFVAAKQAASWKEVWDDWQTLIDMGGDVGGTLDSMKEEIGDLVNESLKIGTEIPAQFKPLVEELIKSGKLFDDNGKAITDIATLKFGAPLVSEVDKIITKIDELIEALSTGLTTAFTNVGNTRVPPVKIPYEWEATNEAPTGGVGMPQYREGTDGKFVDFGAGTPVMLHGWEAVVPRETPGGSTPPLGGAAGAPIQITVISQLDGRQVARNQVKYLPGQLALAGL